MKLVEVFRPSGYAVRAGLILGALAGIGTALEFGDGQSVPAKLAYFVGGSICGLFFGLEAGVLREGEGVWTRRLIDSSVVLVAVVLIIFIVAASLPGSRLQLT